MTRTDGQQPRRACRAGLFWASEADASARRVVGVARDSRGGGPDAPTRGEPAFRGIGQGIETWPGVIAEQWQEGGSYVIDFAVSQNFGEPLDSLVRSPDDVAIRTSNRHGRTFRQLGLQSAGRCCNPLLAFVIESRHQDGAGLGPSLCPTHSNHPANSEGEFYDKR
jgi:hypothetical protein